MIKQATFYILSQQQGKNGLLAEESLACDLAAKAWRSGKRILITCATEEQAFKLDEALWQREPDEFVPHNLSGEITLYATPIEISFGGKRNTQRRDLLINLQSQLPEFITSFNQFIDFVPVDEQLKILARERYKLLRSQNWQLHTEHM